MPRTKKKKEYIEIDRQEVEDLIDRFQQGKESSEDRVLIERCLHMLLWLQSCIREARISLKRLKGIIFGKKTEKGQKTNREGKTDSEEGESKSDKTKSSNSSAIIPRPSKTDKEQLQGAQKGHGRRPQTEFKDLPQQTIKHQKLKSGDACPTSCGGKLYLLPPQVLIRFTGGPFATAKRFERERLRCALCGKVFKATMPGGVDEKKRYDARVKAVLATLKYYLGVPFIVWKSIKK
jgi:transposase